MWHLFWQRERIGAMSVLGNTRVCSALVFALALLVHLPTLNNEFVFDDVPAITENPVVLGQANWTQVFSSDFWGNRAGFDHVTTWRPLTTLSFLANVEAFGLNPMAFHLVNVVLHGLVTWLVFMFVRLLYSRNEAALIAAGIYAVMPVHVEVVAGAVNRAELLAALFYVGGLVLWLKGRTANSFRFLGVALISFVAAVYSKEHAITWPAAIAVLEIYRFFVARRASQASVTRGWPPVWTLVAMMVIVGHYLFLRSQVLGAVLGGDIPHQDNPLVLHGGLSRILTVGKVFFHYLRLLIFPLELTCDYSAHAIPIAESLADYQAVLGLLALATLSIMMMWFVHTHTELSAAIALFLGLFALVGHVLFLNTILMAERLMYLPSVGFCAAVGYLCSLLLAGSGSRNRLVWCVCSVVVALYGARSFDRCGDWQNEHTLFETAVVAFPGSARAQYNLANHRFAQRDYDSAERHLTVSDQIVPGDPQVLNKLGELYWAQKRPHQAVDYYRRSVRSGRTSRAVINLCRGLVVTRQAEEGVRFCAGAVARLPGEIAVRHFFGLALAMTGKTADAIAQLEQALALQPGNQLVINDLRRLKEAR